MVIVQISDTHISLDPPEREQRLNDLRRTVAEINRLDPQPDVVVHTGDLVNRGKAEEYAAAAALLRTLRAPLYVAVGNRDDRMQLRATFAGQGCAADSEPFVQFAVEDHAVRLLVLDTQSQSRAGDYCEARTVGLLKLLAEDPDKPVAVFLHHPPFNVPGADEPYQFQFESREAANRLINALTRSGKVIRIFCGHAHRDTQTQVNGIPASTIPSIAVDLRVGESGNTPTSAPRFQIHHYAAEQGFTTVSREVATC